MTRVAIWAGVVLTLAVFAKAQQHAPVDSSAKQTSAEQLQQPLGKNAKILVIDVRSPQEFAAGHIPGAINIPVEDLAKKPGEMKIVKDTTIVAMCEHGGRSSRVAIDLQKLGHASASYCTLESWKKRGYKIETGDAKPRAADHPPFRSTRGQQSEFSKS